MHDSVKDIIGMCIMCKNTYTINYKSHAIPFPQFKEMQPKNAHHFQSKIPEHFVFQISFCYVQLLNIFLVFMKYYFAIELIGIKFIKSNQFH